MSIKGYKVFKKNWTCRDFQYSCPGIFEMKEKPDICIRGFHFCTDLAECFEYYDYDEDELVVAEVEALGDVDEDEDCTKKCTNKIHIIREIPWDEVYEKVNRGQNNKGILNVGEENIGESNIGSNNRGNNNRGYNNNGDSNHGRMNEGDDNCGDLNHGDCNCGSDNEGNDNYGSYNKGSHNKGNYNYGDYNYGSFNIGNYNCGRGNMGNRNIGWCNKGNNCYGIFCTEPTAVFSLFNKPAEQFKAFSDLESWVTAEHFYVKNALDLLVSQLCWDASHPQSPAGVIQARWGRLETETRNAIMNLPNFDAEIFYEIMGVRI